MKDLGFLVFKIFFKDSFFYSLSNLFSKGIGFLMLPIYTTFFSPRDFGVMDLLLVSGTILSILVGLEIHQAVSRFFPEEQDFLNKKKIVSTAFWTIVVCYSAFSVPAFLFAEYISIYLFQTTDYVFTVRIAIVSYGFNFIYYYTSSQLIWQLKSKQNFLVSVIYSSLTALTAFILLKYFSLGLTAVFVSQIGAAIVAILSAISFSHRYYGLVFDKLLWRRMLAFSLPLVFSSLTVYGMLYADRIMINYLLDTKDLGIYALGYRIASVVGMLTMGSQAALTPLIYNKFKEPETASQIARIFHFFIFGSGLLIATLFVFSKYILLLAPVVYEAAAPLVPWIAMAILFTGLTSFTPGIFIEKKTKIVFYINAVSFLLNLSICYSFVKIFGLMGAVYATALCSLIYFLMYYAIGQRYYFIPFFWERRK